MVHLWLRSETRPNEQRAPLTPEGARDLIARGFRITVEDSRHRILPTAAYAEMGAEIAPPDSWPSAPAAALILGLKELPEADTPLPHRHIMFGHAYKGQPPGHRLLRRLARGGGALYDLEYLTDEQGRRLAAFGYWAGFAGAAVSLRAWAAQRRGGICPPVAASPSRQQLEADLRAELDATGAPRPRAIVVGALGRVGRGAGDLLTAMGVATTRWDMAETAGGGPYPQILDHDLFINCILAGPDSPVLIPAEAAGPARRLTVIGDVACDPGSDFNPIKVYDRVTDWAQPVRRVADRPVLDVMAIDNLPSLLPLESSQDFAAQLLPVLAGLDRIDTGPWGRARALFDRHLAAL
ncbi:MULTISPECIES: saccharopine dehydrogenase [unclassified Paracoccus (in: a-proteobacteria)]|uniref:saccharopine dehydrogenase n=1 Tax=unclassified Paracoccus (in: a-proteobacteria) TaxID=2688777 RepID=UPI0012B372CB|nr:MULTISPECIES: saccharopine dehydrogenase [unclassified Paracoccus (in: a-proteobacteria)]UXU75836.1 saccharopine dehydrogenase [Paracoccus sp. SMMA_5]UXU81745.1 saccharopine dehydrogenase [Paracoccus sp. SMMA_5_TC]